MSVQSSCQKCRQPLTLDESVYASIQRSQFDIINASITGPSPSRLPPSMRSHFGPTSPSAGRHLPTHNLRQPTLTPPATPPYRATPSHPSPSDSFVVLTDSVIHPRAPTPSSSSADGAQTSEAHDSSSLSPRLAQLQKMHALLGPNGGDAVEFPVCTECMDGLLVAMKRELEQDRWERERLQGWEKDVLKRREAEGALTKAELEREIAKLKRAERQSIEELKAVEAQQLALEKEEADLAAEEAAVALEEEQFWLAHASYELSASALRDRSRAVQTRLTHDARELDKLQKTNVYNDAFCIGQEGGFGTINGLRLGRLPAQPVDWPEINAAWGHTLLLLHTIARKFGFNFEGYRLVPMGSYSKIEEERRSSSGALSAPNVLELFGGAGVASIMHNRRFDQAMVAFLDCLRQLSEWVMQRDGQVKLPHRVVRDRIGDVSIKLQFASEESWTRALRHVLLTLKVLLGRASL